MDKYDVLIIGGGPGGYVAALRAARLGLKVALVEGGTVGGVCLNLGCIPTKSIIASVNAYRSLKDAEKFGIKVEGKVSLDISAVISRKNEVVSKLSKGIDQLLKGAGVERISGYAKFESSDTIKVGEKSLQAKNIIIATGSVWKMIPNINLDGKNIITSDTLLTTESIPESIVILGGGVVGCEFASILSALGTKVTIVEAMKSILPMEDEVTSRTLERTFKKEGIAIRTGETVESVTSGRDGVTVKLKGGDEIKAEKLLVAVGRRPNFEGLGAEKIGVAIEKGAIKTDEHMRTNIKGVYAIGDVNGKYMLAHAASEEGIVAVENIAGHAIKMNYNAIPRPVYTSPEICCTGLTARELADEGIEFDTGRFMYGALGKALCDGLSEGQVLIYSEKKNGKILGAQLIGKNATELSAEITLAISKGLTVKDIAAAIHPHPTLSEVIREAAEDADGMAVHKIYPVRRGGA